nr:hypothetical protein [Tanacetum cinerariifolium]
GVRMLALDGLVCESRMVEMLWSWLIILSLKGLYDGGERDCKWTLLESRGESFWEEGDDFGFNVLCFHTCLVNILSFLEKLEWWFEQDLNDEEGWMKRMKIIERIW